MARLPLLLWALAAAAACCSLLLRPVSCGWFGLSQDEMLAKLRANGGELSSEKVYDILHGAKESSWRVDNFSVKELRSLHEFTLSKCTAEELDRRQSLAARPPVDETATCGSVRQYASDQFKQFAIYCARNADKLLRRHIIEIGAQIRQELSYFRTGVQANERRGLERVKSIEEYLAKSQYVNDQYKQTIATGCKTVSEHLRHIVAIQTQAGQLNQPVNLIYSLQEWLLLNDYCKLYIENFANK